MARPPDLDLLLRTANPWLLDPGCLAAEVRRRLPGRLIRRTAERELAATLDDRSRAHLVIGPRQAGKSTVLWSVVRGASFLLYLDCEERLVRDWCTSPLLFLAGARDLLPEGGVLFLEEAQCLDEAGLFVKGLVDARPGWSIFVTGSSSFHLASRTRESLAGRATRHRVWPLGIEEAGCLPPGAAPGMLPAVRRDAVDRLLVLGGYPEAWLASDPAPILLRLVEAFVLRDASDRFRIARPDALRHLLHLAAGQVGDLVNLSEWASILGVAATTVADYLSVLEESQILARPRPFAGGRRSELTSTPKLYFVDNGLRNQLAGGFQPLAARADTGRLMENLVFSELLRRWPWPGQVRYWRTRNGAEVDFVLEPVPGRIVGVEVKAQKLSRPKLTRSSRAFIEAYEPAEFLVVHRGGAAEEAAGRTRIRHVDVGMLPEVLAGLEAIEEG